MVPIDFIYFSKYKAQALIFSASTQIVAMCVTARGNTLQVNLRSERNCKGTAVRPSPLWHHR